MSERTNTPEVAKEAPSTTGDVDGQPDAGGAGRGVGFAEGSAVLSPTGPGAKLGKRQVRAALRYNRGRAFARKPERLAAVQTVLGVPLAASVGTPFVRGAADYQDRHGLKADGKVGRNTQKALSPEIEALAPVSPDATEASESKVEGAQDAAVAVAQAADADAAGTAKAGGSKAEEPLADPVTTQVVAESAALSSLIPKGNKATPAAKPAPAGPLGDKAVAKAARKMQGYKKRFDPTWLMAAQAALGVSSTGGFSRAFIQAIAAFQKTAMGMKKPRGYLTYRGTIKALVAQHVALEGVPVWFDAGASRASRASRKGMGSGATIHTQALKAAGYASSWGSWRSQMGQITFCGRKINGHKKMIGRIAAANAFLDKKYPRLSGTELGAAMGVSRISDWRPPKSANDTRVGFHKFGLAFDINASDNPWILGQDGRKEANTNTREVIDRAVMMMGSGERLTLASMKSLRNHMTTDELFNHLESSNAALKAYRAMKGNSAAVSARLERSPAARQEGDVSYWDKRIAEDDRLLAYRGHRDKKKSNWDSKHATNTGFMTYKEDLIVALRDVAGLAWGGCDLGNDSGDMMHFDMRSTGFGMKLRRKAKALSKDAKKAANGGGG